MLPHAHTHTRLCVGDNRRHKICTAFLLFATRLLHCGGDSRRQTKQTQSDSALISNGNERAPQVKATKSSM